MEHSRYLSNCWPEWKVIEKIGEGSFGTVYKCCKTERGIEVYSAIKVISIAQNGTDGEVSSGMDEASVRFYYKSIVDDCVEEIRLMGAIKGCVNIVSVEDFQVMENEDGSGWVVLIRMELLHRFSERMSRHTFSEEDVVGLGIDICNALQSCSAHHIIHRDVKPANILMTDFGTYKLGDFGISRKLEGTKDGLSSKGTRTYMAPEVLSRSSYGENADVYSLGIVLYQLMNNNRIPFLDPDKAVITYEEKESALEQRLSGKKLPMPARASHGFSKIICKACAFEPEERYATAAEMKKELEMLLLLLRQEALADDDKTIAIHELSMDDITQVAGTKTQTQTKARTQTQSQSDWQMHLEKKPPVVKEGKNTFAKKALLMVCVAAVCTFAGVFLSYVFREPSFHLSESVTTAAEAVENTNLSPKPQTSSAAVQTDREPATIVVTSVVVETSLVYVPQTTVEISTVRPVDSASSATAFISYDTPGHAGVNLRSTPSSNGTKLAILSEGTRIVLTNRSENGYIYCSASGVYGWVLENYITYNSSANQNNAAAIVGTAFVSYETPGGAGVNFRSEPASASTGLAVLSEGTTVGYTNITQNGYTYCYSDGMYGWIMSTYLVY